MKTRKYVGLTVRPGRPEKYERAHIRYVDPRTGKRCTRALPDLTGDALHRWLLGQSAAILAARATFVHEPDVLPLELLIEKYLAERHRLRASTLKQYRYSLEKFARWLGTKQPVTRARLRAFRAFLDQPGTAAASVNRDLTHVAAFLNHARAAGSLQVSRDEISEGLKRLPADHEKKTPLTADELRELVRSLASAPPVYRAFVLVLLLTGMRATECLRLRPEQITTAGIVLRMSDTKTKRGRTVDLYISPACVRLLAGFSGWGLTRDQVRTLRERLHPWATFQRLRVTCGTYLTCAPGIYGGASAYLSAARLGHSVTIAEKHYVGVVRVPITARTLEEAMGIDQLLTTCPRLADS